MESWSQDANGNATSILGGLPEVKKLVFIVALCPWIAVPNERTCKLTVNVVHASDGLPLAEPELSIVRLEGDRRTGVYWRNGQELVPGAYELSVSHKGFRSTRLIVELESKELTIVVELRLGLVGSDHLAGQWFSRGGLPSGCERVSLVSRFNPDAERIVFSLRGERTYVEGLRGGIYLVVVEAGARLCAIEMHGVGYGRDGKVIELGVKSR